MADDLLKKKFKPCVVESPQYTEMCLEDGLIIWVDWGIHSAVELGYNEKRRLVAIRLHDSARLKYMGEIPKVGSCYRHVATGRAYEVTAITVFEEDQELLVNYREVGSIGGSTWSRRLSIFMDGRFKPMESK